jgi:aconitate hydratase
VPLLVLAGKEYGSGSSRDWAAKGTALLGVRAVIAESFERDPPRQSRQHGRVAAALRAGQGWRALGLTGDESFTLLGVRDAVLDGQPDHGARRRTRHHARFVVTAEIQTAAERRMLATAAAAVGVQAPATGKATTT